MYSTPVYSTAKAGYSTHPPFSDAGKSVACIAGGIISVREIKFWQRSRQACGKAASGASPLASGGSSVKTLFRVRHTASYAGYDVRSPQPSLCLLQNFSHAILLCFVRHKVRHKVTCQLCECRFLTVNVGNTDRALIFKAWILL